MKIIVKHVLGSTYKSIVAKNGCIDCDANGNHIDSNICLKLGNCFGIVYKEIKITDILNQL